jgi:hypothetical protein
VSDKPSRAPAPADDSLINDPEFPWAGGCPYDVLNKRLQESKQPLLGRNSPTADVNNAGFALQAARASPTEKKAWNQLRLPRERLVIDFFHYPLPDLRIEDIEPSALDRQMPVAAPDLMGIADLSFELAAAPEAPAQVALHDVTLSGLMDVGLAELLPSPLCRASLKLADLIEVEDDDR